MVATGEANLLRWRPGTCKIKSILGEGEGALGDGWQVIAINQKNTS